MKLQLLYSLTIFLFAFQQSRAAISPKVYWKVKLPNTQMPQVIKDFLPLAGDEVRELKYKSDTAEKVYSGLHKPLSAFAWHRAATEAEVRELKQDKSDTKEKVYYGVHKPITAFAWHRAATEEEVRELKQDRSETKEKVYYGVHKPITAFAWHRAATEGEVRELKQDKKDTIDECHGAKTDAKETYLYKTFFLEKDLEKGNVINFFSLKNKNEAPFLPRQLAESIPFSLKKIPKILNYFSIDTNSKDAEAIEETIKLCEEPEIKHKEKHTCATSLESMVDFSISALGTHNIMANTTKVEGETQKLQDYTIQNVQHISEGDNMVCHKLSYTYAVHYCHIGGGTKTFMVSMVGVDGTKVEAVTVCHKDTSFWNPKGLPFVVLNVKPGTTSICHFLHDDQILFVPVKEAKASRYAI